MIVGFGLLLYNYLFSRISRRWAVLIVAGAVGITAVFLISDSVVGFIISNLTFSPESGYYREWTWQMVGLYVSQSPWVGLGFGRMPDEINHSIDSLWLVLSIQSGYPGAVLVGLSLVGAAPISTNGRNAVLTPAEAKLKTTLGILLFLTLYFAFTVHLWGSSWILIGLLIGTKAHLGELGYLRPGAASQRLS
jgi:O-antigen ligase